MQMMNSWGKSYNSEMQILNSGKRSELIDVNRILGKKSELWDANRSLRKKSKLRDANAEFREKRQNCEIPMLNSGNKVRTQTNTRENLEARPSLQ